MVTVILIAVWVWSYLGGVSVRPTAVRTWLVTFAETLHAHDTSLDS